MAQDRSSGAEAWRYGKETAARIARILGVRPNGPGNEGDRQGHRRVIKCARRRTSKIGVYYTTLGRVAEIIAILEGEDGSCSLYTLSTDWFRAHMGPAAGSGAGRSGVVTRGDITRERAAFRVISQEELKAERMPEGPGA